MKKILCFLGLLFFQFHLYGGSYLFTIEPSALLNSLHETSEVQQPVEEEDDYTARNSFRTILRQIQLAKYTFRTTSDLLLRHALHGPETLLSTKSLKKNAYPFSPLSGHSPHETYCVFLI